jgi:hypothetical protein
MNIPTPTIMALKIGPKTRNIGFLEKDGHDFD